MKLRLIAAILLMVFTIAVPAASDGARGPKIVNVMPTFWAFMAEVHPGMPLAAQDQLFRELVLNPYQNIYGLQEFNRDTSDDGIERYLQRVQPYLPQMRALSGEVQSAVAPAEAHFMETFPDFDAKVTVAYLPSLMHFDGETTHLENGELAVLFGVDGIARFHGNDAGTWRCSSATNCSMLIMPR